MIKHHLIRGIAVLAMVILLSIAGIRCGRGFSTQTSGGTSCKLSTTWTTLDDFNYVTGRDATASSIVADSQGNLYVAGEGSDSSGKKHWIVRTSSDRGKTWSILDDYVYQTGTDTEAYSIFADADNALYAVGGGNDYRQWIVRKKTATSSNFSNVDSVEGDTGNQVFASTGYATRSGKLFVSGTLPTTGLNRTSPIWKTRMSSDQGANWTQVDQEPGDSGALPNSIFEDSTGQVFTAGYNILSDGQGTLKWIVRKSTNGTSIWSYAETFQQATGFTSLAQGGALSSSGALYVAGGGATSSTKMLMTIRKSSDNGTNWSTVDSYQYDSGTAWAYYLAITATSSGNLFATGTALAGTDTNATKYHWITRTSSDGSTWSNSDDFILATDKNALAKAITSDRSGNVFAVGKAVDSSNVTHWIVRKLGCE